MQPLTRYGCHGSIDIIRVKIAKTEQQSGKKNSFKTSRTNFKKIEFTSLFCSTFTNKCSFNGSDASVKETNNFMLIIIAKISKYHRQHR